MTGKATSSSRADTPWRGERMALVTVATEDYLPGTLVMIDSFLRHNAWFGGDAVVIHRDLSRTARDALSSIGRGCLFHEVSEELAAKMDAVSVAAGWRSGKAMQFASIEAFSLEQYDRVIFCDSDLLFLGSIAELGDFDSPLIACGDGAHYRGNSRRIADFAEIERSVATPDTDCISGTFNSGMMILAPPVLSRANFKSLLMMMEPDRWADDATGHTDQMLLNLQFAGRYPLAPAQFNFMLSHKDLIQKATDCTVEQARVLHFTGAAKPWRRFEELASMGLDHEEFAAFANWRDAYALLERLIPLDKDHV